MGAEMQVSMVDKTQKAANNENEAGLLQALAFLEYPVSDRAGYQILKSRYVLSVLEKSGATIEATHKMKELFRGWGECTEIGKWNNR